MRLNMKIELNNHIIRVNVIQSKGKYGNFRIKYVNTDCINFYSRKNLKESQIKESLFKHKDLIYKWISVPKVTLNENELCLLGKIYKIGDVNNDEKSIITRKEAEAKTKTAYEIVKNLFYSLQKNYDFPESELMFWKMRSRWGSCYVEKRIIKLSSYIIYLPIDLIEYVILHEFTHYKQPNHSKFFYIELGKVCPSYKIAISKIKQYNFLTK